MAVFSINIDNSLKPIAQNLAHTVTPNTAKLMDATENAYFPTGFKSISVEIAPVNGTATVVGGTDIEYVPNLDFVGTDAFWYKIEDTNTNTDIAKITIIID